MCEYTKEIKFEGKESAITPSVKKIAFRYFIRTAALFLIYYLLSNNFTIFNCIVCILLLASALFDTIAFERK